MVEMKGLLIMGNIYDPDTDCQYILMRMTAKDWDDYQRKMDDIELNEVE